jgi:lipopolysaccharide/colanic/teichoic acid biosynthesis glycosyltransferase/glycosyltransferase involved in cell wall biosynthesis
MQERVAIVHDWLTSMRGGERVVEVLCEMFPRADLFTLTWDPSRLSPALARRSARTSAIHRVAKIPFVNGRFRGLLPLFPLAIESFDLNPYTLVLSSSHCVALGALAPASALHVAYIHSTLRYVREAQSTYEASVPGGTVGRALFRGTARYLRKWDTAAGRRPHLLIANSRYTRDRVRKYYERDALVIEPPIETGRFERAARHNGDGGAAPFLMISALVPNKRVDLALRAFQGRSENLVVVGEGPEYERLLPLGGPNVTFLHHVDDAKLDVLLAQCRALVHTGIDDFGMVMVEALAAGKPLIACAEGGALDIAVDGETGVLIHAPTVAAVRAALDRFVSVSFDPARLQAFARRFDRKNFEKRLSDAIDGARCERTRSAKVSGAAPHAASARSNGAAHRKTPTEALDAAPPRAPGSLSSSVTASRRAQTPEQAIAVERSARTPSPFALAAKRAIDVGVAATGLLATAPLLGALVALVTLDSSGTAFFHQRRTGREQQPFTMVKLRTFDADGRVTRVGRFLRPTGLDELPQLWNIVVGDMSLIGPRPEIPELVERFTRELPAYPARHLMRPGITGWAQVNGLRGCVSIAERLRFDLEYQRNWSLLLDARILLRTFGTVFRDTIRELKWGRTPAGQD